MKVIRAIAKVLLTPMLVLMAWRGNPENLVLDKMREIKHDSATSIIIL